MEINAWNGLIVITLLLCFGCAAPKPAQMPMTDRDKQTYMDKGAVDKKKETKQRVAILVNECKLPNGKAVVDALDSALTSVISDFAFFTVVERSNLDALLKEQALESLNKDEHAKIEIPGADYLITAAVNAARVEKKETQSLLPGVTTSSTSSTAPAYYASTSVDFRFYEKITQRTVLTKNIEAASPNKIDSQNSQGAVEQLAVAAQECAKKFAMELGSRYAPPARVVETRGSGKVAKITIGSDYGLANGIKVEFYEYVDNSDIVAGAKREASPVGYGFILEANLHGSWIEVENPESVTVKRGHYVKITSDQSKGLKTQVKDMMKINL